MAERRSTSDQPNCVKVWTFIIRGGQPLSLRLQRLGPGHEHNGRHSVWKLVGTAEEAVAAEALLTGPLVGAQVIRTTEEEDDTMLELRHRGEI